MYSALGVMEHVGQPATLSECPTHLSSHSDRDDHVDGHDGGHVDGYPAHSHHDKFPPWWDFVRDDDGGNLSVTKSHH